MSSGLFYIAGSLTSLYVPPSACFTPALDNDATSFRHFGASCSIDSNEQIFTPHPFTDFSCFPTITNDYIKAFNSITNQGYVTHVVYSPGLICPSGFELNFAAFKATNDYGTVTQTTSSSNKVEYMLASLLAGESGYVCCPTGGWTADVDSLGPFCTSQVTVGQVMTGIAFGTGSTCETFPTTITQPPDLSTGYLAAAIVLLRKDTDPPYTTNLPESVVQSIVAESSSLAASLSSASVASNQVTKVITQTPSNSDSSDSGLSGGAKIGIGVGVALPVVLAAGAGALFYWMRMRKRLGKLASSETSGSGAWKPELEGSPALKELEGYENATRSSDGVQYTKMPPVELEGSGAVYELPR